MDLTHEDVLQILRLIDASNCQEFVLELGNCKLSVKRGGAQGAGVPDVTSDGGAAVRKALPQPSPGESLPALSAPAPTQDEMNRVAARPGVSPQSQNAKVIKAPMVGRFYASPAPDAPPFVQVGSEVSADDVVCIVEVMKLFNQIKAGVKGRVAAICVENGAMIEFGQELIVIEPVE